MQGGSGQGYMPGGGKGGMGQGLMGKQPDGSVLNRGANPYMPASGAPGFGNKPLVGNPMTRAIDPNQGQQFDPWARSRELAGIGNKPGYDMTGGVNTFNKLPGATWGSIPGQNSGNPGLDAYARSGQGFNPGVLKGGPQMISDPYRNYGQSPTMGGPQMSKPFTVNQPMPQPTQQPPMISDPYREYGRPPQPVQSGPMPQQPQMIPGTNRPMPPGAFIDEYGITRRAPETPFNPGAGQFGQYGNIQGDGFTGTRGGQNFVNGNLFAAEGLNQGGGPQGLGVGFGNWLNKYGPMLNRR